MKAFIKYHQGYFLWIGLIIFLSFASFWRVFSFGLWKDDWSLIWSSLYNTRYYHGYFNHPGTPFEFFFLSKIFGTNAILWQSVGFLLHVVVSILVGIFIQTITRSKKTGILAGLFFAVSYLGLETIYFASVHVIQIAAIPLLLSLIFFIRSFKKLKPNILFSFLFFIFSLFLDPPRIAPIIILIPLLIFIFPKNKTVKFFKKIMVIVYPLFSILVGFTLIWWFIKYSPNTLLGKAIHQTLINPYFLWQKSHVIGHLLAAIANIFTGLIYGLGQDEQNTGIYSRLFGYLGLGIFLVTVGTFITWIKTASNAANRKKQTLGIITFFLFWIFIFYFPNWLSEPRAPMAGAHRYIFLSSIGFVGLVAYLFSLIKNLKLLTVIAIIFILLNIYKANMLLSWQYTYRSNAIVTNIWNTINHDVPAKETNSIFMFFGAQPWVSEDIGLSGAAPFALLRNGLISSPREQFTIPTQMPIFTVDTHAILNYVCKSHQSIINLYFVAYKNNRVSLSHIHAWNVLPGGKLIDISGKEQKILKQLAEKKGCKPLVN